MNNFLELHSSADYLNINRPYYTGTWEYIQIASDYLIPFQFYSDGADSITIDKENADGDFTDITSFFINTTNKITSLSKTGGGSWYVISAEVISTGTVDAGGYMTSNAMTLTAGVPYVLFVESDAYSPRGSFEVSLEKAGSPVFYEDLGLWDGIKYFTVSTTGSDYTLKLENSSGSTANSVEANGLEIYESLITNSGNYWWYNGDQLGTAIQGVNRLRITCGAETFYSDWMDTCGFDGKLKYKLTSDYDYGGVAYTTGYEQWIYKNASVRRSPRAEIDQVGTQRNGVLILEKSVSAVRYVINMKVTEAEYEAFVHSVGGTVEITDQTGKVYNATNIEISDPTWHRSNGLLEISFTDENNISIWTKNN